MKREGWRFDLVESQIDEVGAGQLLYRIEAGDHVMHLLAFSYEPKMVNRSPRIIGSSWDIEGALIDGEVSQEEIRQTRLAIPRLYAGRATPNTLIWFRANRSIRLFDEVVASLVKGEQPDVSSIAQVGYLVRNTGLDGNGTFGTKDFQCYEPEHPLAVPYHAQLFTAYMMRELSVDLVNLMAHARKASAVQIDQATRASIAVGNGSALGLVLLTMNRPHLVNAWLSGYESLRGEAAAQPLTDDRWRRLDRMLSESIEMKDADATDYGVFPSGEAFAVDLKVIRRQLRRCHSSNSSEGPVTIGAALDGLPGTLCPEAIELVHAMTLEFVAQDRVDEVLASLKVDERKQLNPVETVRDVQSAIEESFPWVFDFPRADELDRNRVWYKSRNSEEPRSGPAEEVPARTNDLAVDMLSEVAHLHSALMRSDPDERIGRWVVSFPELLQTTAHVQSIVDLPFAVPRADVRDRDFVPAYLIRLFNAFCFGLEKTHDVHQRNLRGLIFDGAPFRQDRTEADADWRWSVDSQKENAEHE